MASQQQVLDLHHQHPGWSAMDIARELGCSAGYVRATARRLKLTLPHAKPDSLMALGAAARDAGLTVADIEAIGKSRARKGPAVATAIAAMTLIAAIVVTCISIASRIAEAAL